MPRDSASRLAALAERLEADPSALAAVRGEGDGLAREVEGDAGLRWRLAVAQAVIAAPPDGDAVRELYGELVDRYRADPDRLARVRALGEDIRRREQAGELPSTLVARSRRRP